MYGSIEGNEQGEIIRVNENLVIKRTFISQLSNRSDFSFGPTSETISSVWAVGLPLCKNLEQIFHKFSIAFNSSEVKWVRRELIKKI